VSNEVDWTEGLCTQTDPDIFFPELGDGDSSYAAKSVCASCALVTPCLMGAIERNEQFGIWGGANYKTRRRIIRGEITIQFHIKDLSKHKKG
jgi:WhiB family redox-sensing transcriptional regulator